MRIIVTESGSGGGSSVAQRTGSEPITNGNTSLIITFSSPMASTNYSITWGITNTVDADPIMLQVIQTTKTVGGFTATFNAPADSVNYILEYAVCEHI